MTINTTGANLVVWNGPPSGDDVLSDVREMIRLLQGDKAYGPYEIHLPLDHVAEILRRELRDLRASRRGRLSSRAAKRRRRDLRAEARRLEIVL